MRIRSFHHTAQLLEPREKRAMLLQSLADAAVSLLDVGFLALLLLLVNFYMHPDRNGRFHTLLYGHAAIVFGLYCLAYAVKNAAGYWLVRAQNQLAYAVSGRLARSRLEQYFDGDYDQFVQTDSAVHIRRISHQPTEFANYVMKGWQTVISQGLLVTIAMAAIIGYDARLFVLLLSVLLVPLLFTAWLLKRKAFGLRAGSRRAGERALQHLKEALAGFVESRIYFKKDFFVRRYMNGQRQLNQFMSAQQTLSALPARLMEVFAVAGLFLLLVFDPVLPGGTASFVTLGAFLAAAYKIIPGIVRVMNALGQIGLYNFVTQDLNQPAAVNPVMDTSRPSAIRSIAFDQVSFGYSGKNIFHSFCFHLTQGDLAGVSGVSGRGKTTLVNLLLGFIQPVSGSVLVNGHRLRDRAALWQRVSYVRQQSFFIHDSALQNVVMDEELHDAARLERVAGRTGFQQVGEGRSTITENGRNLSGGQRQRLALARALYKDFDLLILDEPFSELDETAEQELLQELKDIARQGKIVLLITHNPASLRHCNKIIALDGYI